jgi:hypothetical protein
MHALARSPPAAAHHKIPSPGNDAQCVVDISAPFSKKIGQIRSSRTTGVSMSVHSHDGKEARRMERKATGRRKSSVSDPHAESPASLNTVKVTLHLSVETAQRLGVESAMRRVSQSAIADEVLATYLSRWQLPALTTQEQAEAG